MVKQSRGALFKWNKDFLRVRDYPELWYGGSNKLLFLRNVLNQFLSSSHLLSWGKGRKTLYESKKALVIFRQWLDLVG